ncbi:Pycsar system effector family protein [Sphingobacterium composti Ten et al. 2007 non Yoo et al. 2007]|uniref:Pycsar system effector family protein n=1 Tax=Sphingobacterium composti TaxID=363260 RepID=UPI001358A2A9|nr:Pycsar system effector family protein [Sphingobacterium composti Ten et al. 2007 non Yoo et al. 2007]
MNLDKKINQAETNLQRKLEWVGRHDSRTVFVTGIIIAMLGILASASSKMINWTICDYTVFGLTALLLFGSLLFIYRSQYPKTFSQNTSLNYFGTISEMKFDEFKRRTKQSSDEEYLEDMLCQIHINSQILKLKFKFLKISFILLGTAVIPWLISIYLSHEYFK